MLENDHVPLPRLVAEPVDHEGGQIVEGRGFRRGEGLGLEEPQPFEAGHDGRSRFEPEPGGHGGLGVGARGGLGELPHESVERDARAVFRGFVEKTDLDHLPTAASARLGLAASVEMLGAGAPRPAHAASSSRDGYTPLLLTSPFTFTSGSPASPFVSSAAFTAASSAKAAGCCERLKRSTVTPWLLQPVEVGSEAGELRVDGRPADTGRAAHGGIEDANGRHGVILLFIGDESMGWAHGRPSQARHQHLEAAQGAGLDAVTDARPVDLAADEAGFLEHLEVLGDGRLGERELVHDVAADTRRLAHQDADDLHACRVRDRLRERRELLVGLLALDGPKIGLDARLGDSSPVAARSFIVDIR